ncbi:MULTISPECIES: quinolinate synthase NadA [Desulfosporosinus]|uniref:Quinolinate synthase n=1 Tax=Desulfosporosinus nitroreducens TaxID=2018668 RepID=A0ABT8QTL1_9FIRM|nr:MULTISPECIES: quinolinate synthase NadA [Desulfosporosinus]MCO1604168.1 quinolinate synthase NadA [Desulfosporosinus nitroreducens]MCO5386306.1 quinolinate synthase NadA [Desulfosporosinus sp.]MDA8221205.1 quinolinate synthase NadA [Desulfitobacterium hafniense]MDO0823919.1 quinolinate synthase NadA [Desulfosporosinus nitroreducens]
MNYTISQDLFETLAAEIEVLKKERKAVILAHYYQRPEVQDIADFVGDSLQLSQQAANTDAEVIVFCGVHFMAESAAILSPNKVVILPDQKAGCPMADMVDADGLRAYKKRVPEVQVVCYVNSSAEVKAESDICCTSSNAVKVVQSLQGDNILFIPDENLGRYAAKILGRSLQFWPGYCKTHDRLSKEDIQRAKNEHPSAKVIVHPECREDICEAADYVGSTAGLIKYAQNSENQEFIVGTESGILHRLHQVCPEKKFYLASERLVCPNMKLTSLEKVRDALKNLSPRVTVKEEIRVKAKAALERMLAL